MLIFRAGEELVQRAQYRKDTGLTAALFLGEPRVALAHCAGDALLADFAEVGRREAAQRLANLRDQDAAAGIERLDRDMAVPRRKDERRVDKAHIEPRITARKFEARRQEDAAPVIERPR